jgi:Rod binding domain-containing protein
MNNAELMLIQPFTGPMQLKQLSDSDKVSEHRKEQIAKDFESLLINKVLDQMKDTIGDWGFEKDGAGRQIYGMFWFYLAQGLADTGGFGLYKDLYQSLTGFKQTNQGMDLLDTSI